MGSYGDQCACRARERFQSPSGCAVCACRAVIQMGRQMFWRSSAPNRSAAIQAGYTMFLEV